MTKKQIVSQQCSTQAHPISLSKLVDALGAKLVWPTGQTANERQIKRVGTIQSAKQGDITFLNNSAHLHKYKQFLSSLNAEALITTQEIYDQQPEMAIPVVVHPEPRKAILEVAHLLFPKQVFDVGHHSSVVIGQGCDIHPTTHIGTHVSIGNNVTIEEGVIIQSNCVIGDNVHIGKRTQLFPQVSVYHGSQIGKDCVINSHVVIGSDGFGFERKGAHWVKVPQIGCVVIGDRVDIGAGTTIDRGAMDDTVIGNDVILDNLIQIGHNVTIGSGTAIAACVGIAGSTEIGSNCLIGGASNFNGHIKITDGVNLVGCSNVAKSITTPGTYASTITVTDMRTWKKNLLRFHQLDKLASRVTQIESQLETSEGD